MQRGWAMDGIDPIAAVVILLVMAAVVLILLRTRIWTGF
jgi:hypothetical protein